MMKKRKERQEDKTLKYIEMGKKDNTIELNE